MLQRAQKHFWTDKGGQSEEGKSAKQEQEAEEVEREEEVLKEFAGGG